MRLLITIVSALLLVSQALSAKACVKSKTSVKGGNACRGDLIFSDEFDTLNLHNWQHENTLAGGGNWEFQWYTNNRSNSFVQDGILHIKPTLTADHIGEAALSSQVLDLNGGAPADYCTDASNYGCSRTGSPDNILNPIKSARLRTVNSFTFKYGRVEVRAKMPAGDWLWPAIWMMPSQNAYGGWPTSGEIDILESRGNRELVQNGVNIGTQMIGSTLHWGPDFWHNGYPKTHWEAKNAAGYNSDFHTYELEWTEDYLKFSVDGIQVGMVSPPAGGFWELGELGSSGLDNPWKRNTKMAPFDQEYYLIMNLAVGGVAYFPDDASNPTGKPWNNESPTAARDFWNARGNWLPTWNLNQNDDAALKVDYVRVYAL